MRKENHASPKRGISKMKSQGSAASGLKTLQYQTRKYAGNRLSLNALAVVHGRLSRHNESHSNGSARPDTGQTPARHTRYLIEIASPLKSAFAISPTWWPAKCSTAPF